MVRSVYNNAQSLALSKAQRKHRCNPGSPIKEFLEYQSEDSMPCKRAYQGETLIICCMSHSARSEPLVVWPALVNIRIGGCREATHNLGFEPKKMATANVIFAF